MNSSKIFICIANTLAVAFVYTSDLDGQLKIAFTSLFMLISMCAIAIIGKLEEEKK